MLLIIKNTCAYKLFNYFSVIYESGYGNTYCKQALKAVDIVRCMICGGPCIFNYSHNNILSMCQDCGYIM